MSDDAQLVAQPEHTSLDTQTTSGTQPCADAHWVHQQRNAIADALDQRWPKRAEAMRKCGEAGVAMQCRSCGTINIFPYRCGARTCPACARRAAAALVDRMMARVAVHDLLMEAEPWDDPGKRQHRGWKLLTLTSHAILDVDERFDPDNLRHQIKAVRTAFRRFWRTTDWGRQVRGSGIRKKRSRSDTSYVLAEEVSPTGMVHLHVAVYGEFIPQRGLQTTWSEAMGGESLVDIRAVVSAHGLASAFREVLKYATKGEKGARTQPVHAAAVEVAFKNVRRVEVGGALRKVRVSETDGATDDATPEDLHDYREAACIACGSIGRWRWSGSMSPDMVALQGGFNPIVDG